MKRTGIPFLWRNYVKEKAQERVIVTGFEPPNIFYKGVNGEFKGLDITGGVKYVKGNSKGVDITGGVKYVDYGNSKGFDITGLVKIVYDKNSEGVDITGGIKAVGGDSKGFDVTGVAKLVDGNSKGVNLTGGINYSKNVKDWLIEYGTLVNIVEKAPDEAFVLQVGLWNSIGNQHCPIINIKGMKNLSRILGLKKEKK